jgi:hypothetical protein
VHYCFEEVIGIATQLWTWCHLEPLVVFQDGLRDCMPAQRLAVFARILNILKSSQDGFRSELGRRTMKVLDSGGACGFPQSPQKRRCGHEVGGVEPFGELGIDRMQNIHCFCDPTLSLS